ncbi:hypothetical protein [Propionigenium maris]|uniref:hypothetical protein n=1 Tax=Propionigenium maris TaxID=45622 RepID=UPI00248F7AA3|nr:hypothetical protein [Propionigenium maris]
MSRIRRCLVEGEEIVVETETAGLSYTLWSIFLLAIVIFSFNISADLGLKLILVSFLLIYLIKRNVDNQELVLTNRRVLHSTGGGVVRGIYIEEIEAMSIIGNNGLQGNLKIVGKGSEIIKTHWITDPITFKVAMSKQIQINKSRI